MHILSLGCQLINLLLPALVLKSRRSLNCRKFRIAWEGEMLAGSCPLKFWTNLRRNSANKYFWKVFGKNKTRTTSCFACKIVIQKSSLSKATVNVDVNETPRAYRRQVWRFTSIFYLLLYWNRVLKTQFSKRHCSHFSQTSETIVAELKDGKTWEQCGR